MPSLKPHKAKQVSSLGESPAEARRRMAQTSGGAVPPESESQASLGEKVDGNLTPQHIAAIREVDEGFKSNGSSDGSVQDVEEVTEPPTPSKAMEMIQQLSQDKLQLQTERDAALNKVARYEAKYGELD